MDIQPPEGAPKQYTLAQAAKAGRLIKPVPGYPGYYVSSLGELFGKTGRVRKLRADEKGYVRVTLRKKGEKPVTKYLTHLIWEAFVGPIPDGMTIHALDRDPSNVKLLNLIVISHKDNTAINWKGQTIQATGIQSRDRNPIEATDPADPFFKKQFPSARSAAVWASGNPGSSDHLARAARAGKVAYGYKWRFLDK